MGHELKSEIPKEKTKGKRESFANFFVENISTSTSNFLKTDIDLSR